MKRVFQWECFQRGGLGLIASILLMSSTACANQEGKPEPAVKVEGAEPALESKLVMFNGVSSVQNPRILVKFEPNTSARGAPLCPTGTAFKLNINGQDVILPTGVPTNALPVTGTRRNSITWVAADANYQELENLSDFRFEVYFHPFRNSDRRDYRSRNVNESGKVINRAGPLEMRARRLLPEDVSYKYTIARIEQVNVGNQQRWAIMEACKPLDPLIRVY